MFRLLKNIKFVLIVALVLIFVSCLDNNPNEVVYSPEKEDAQIEEFLNNAITLGYDVDTLDSGAFQIEFMEGEGMILDSLLDKDVIVYEGNDVIVDSIEIGIEYIGSFLSGGIFDASSNHGDGTYRYQLNDFDGFISGWKSVLRKMNLGAEGVFLFPSEIAYGASGSYSIPPFTPLIFEMKLVEINYPD